MTVCTPATRGFLEALYPSSVRVDGQFLELCAWVGGGKRDDGTDIPKGPIETKFVELADGAWLDDALAFAERCAGETRNVYFGVAPRWRTVEPPHRSKDVDVDRIAALWCDVDAPKDERGQYSDLTWKSKARKLFDTALRAAEPSARISSGGGFHLYYFLKEPITDLKLAREVLARIIKRVDGDPMGKNLSRLLRLPGPPNVKRPDKPLETGVDYCRETARYTIEQILETFPEEKPKKKRERADVHTEKDGGERKRALTERERERVLEFWADGKRRASCLAVAGAMRKCGWSEEDALDEITILSDLAGGNTADRQLIVRTTYRETDLEKIIGWEALRELGVKDGELASIERPLAHQKTHGAEGRHNDFGNARAFVGDHKEDLRFIHETGRWLAWDGKRWSRRSDIAVMQAAKRTALRMLEEAEEIPAEDEELADYREIAIKWARRSGNEKPLNAMISLAEDEQEVAIYPEQLDRDPVVLNVNNGTLDLRTGRLKEHDRKDLITHLVPIDFNEDATCPRWWQFLDEIFLGREDLIEFVRLAVGYTLTGFVSEESFFLLHGIGSNGKSKFIGVLDHLLGDFAQTIDFESIASNKYGGGAIPNDLAKLQGARLVTSIESEDGQRFNESRLKKMTGGDKITARFLHKEFFEFKPTFKLWIATNYKPNVRGEDVAIWRRIKLVPFEARFDDASKNKDTDLEAKLAAELPGILTWAVTGAMAWIDRRKLPQSEAMDVAANEYKEESDMIGRFLDSDLLERGPGFFISSSRMYELFKRWGEAAGEQSTSFFSQNKLGRVLKQRGISDNRSSKERGFVGFRERGGEAGKSGAMRDRGLYD